MLHHWDHKQSQRPIDWAKKSDRGLLLFIRLNRGPSKWSQCKVGNVKSQLAMAKEIMHRLEIATLGTEWMAWNGLEKKLKHHCLELASLEQTIARFHSRILFDKRDFVLKLFKTAIQNNYAVMSLQYEGVNVWGKPSLPISGQWPMIEVLQHPTSSVNRRESRRQCLFVIGICITNLLYDDPSP